MSVRWTTVNGGLIISDRQRSGYSYRIRDCGKYFLAIGEGGVTDNKPVRKGNCSSSVAAMQLVDQWEREQ